MKSPKIKKIEIKRIQWQIKDCGPGTYSSWMTYNPGVNLSMGKHMTSIYTDRGVVGSYPISHDISRIAHDLLGRNPLAREEIWQDFNKFHLGGLHASVDIILWDILGKMNMLLSGSTDFIRGNVNGDGITGTKKLASAAETVGADIEIHGVGPAQRHVMSAIGNSNYYEMVWVHPDTECLQLTSDIFLEGYEDGLEAVDADGNVDVPDGPGMGVEWNWDAINKMTVGTKIID